MNSFGGRIFITSWRVKLCCFTNKLKGQKLSKTLRKRRKKKTMKRSENFKEESETQTELSWTFVNEQTEVEAKSWGTNSLEQETNLEKVFALNNFPVKQQQILES